MVPWYFEHAAWLALPVAIAIVVLTSVYVRWSGGKRSRAQAKKRRDALGDPGVELHPRDEDHAIAVRGSLKLKGDPTKRYEDGKGAAATTMEVSAARTWYEAPQLDVASHRRAETLELNVGGKLVALEGRIVVKVGSTEHWPAEDVKSTDDEVARIILSDGGFDPRLCDGYPVYRSLHDGDEVIARGTLSGSRDDGEQSVGYRDAARRWRLHAGGDYAIQLASTKPPRYRGKRDLLLVGPALIVAIGVVGYAYLFVARSPDGVQKRCEAECVYSGRCTAKVVWDAVGTRIVCERGGDPPCHLTHACTDLGRCTPADGTCLATERTDCLPTFGCRQHGQCSAVDGKCKVAIDEDCAISRICKDDGQCTAHTEHLEPFCGYGSDADCQKTPNCKLKGMCSFRDDRCIAASDEDCRSARYCKEDGLCSFDPKRQLCHAKKDSDCEGSRACRELSRCTAQHDVCRKSSMR